MYQVPETPHWLIAHGRPDDAMRSLQWLRGWVSPDAVAAEYTELTYYIDHAGACDECRLKARSVPTTEKCTHPSTYVQKIQDLFRPKTLRPFGLLMLMFFVVQISGNSAIRPFLVQIFQTFRLPIDANWASVSCLYEICVHWSCHLLDIVILPKKGAHGCDRHCFWNFLHRCYTAVWQTTTVSERPDWCGRFLQRNCHQCIAFLWPNDKHILSAASDSGHSTIERQLHGTGAVHWIGSLGKYRELYAMDIKQWGVSVSDSWNGLRHLVGVQLCLHFYRNKDVL